MVHHKHGVRLRSSLCGPLGPDKQHGVALIFTAFFLLALVAALGLAIDVGRLYAAQQHLQTAADIAALETARFAGGCRELSGSESLQSIAQDAVNRSFPTSGGNTSAGVNVTNIGTGVVVVNDGIQTLAATPPNTRASAVALTVTDSSYAPLFIGLFTSPGNLTASAAATNRPEGQISMGTTLVGLNPTLLGALLPINIGAAQQGDLANVSVSLAELLDIDAGVATREDLLSTSLNEALTNVSDTVSGQVAGLINELAGLFPNNANAASLLDILDVAGEVGSDLRVNAGALVNAAAQLAASQRDSTIALPLSLTLPAGIADVSANLRILEPPVLAAGPPGQRPDGSFFTQAQTAQVGIELGVRLADINIGGLGLFGLSVLRVTLLDLPLVVQGALGEAHLTDIDCANANQPFHRVNIGATSSFLRAGVGQLSDLEGDGDLEFEPGQANVLDNVTLAGLPLGGSSLITVSGDTTLFPSAADAEFTNIRDVEQDLPDSREVGGNLSTQQLLGGLLSGLNLDVDIVGINLLPVGALLQPINTLLAGPLAAALGPALDLVLVPLGLSLGTGEVQLLDLNVEQTRQFCSRNCLAAPAGG